MLASFKTFFLLLYLRIAKLTVSPEPKKLLNHNNWRFSKKSKILIVLAIIAILFISAFTFLPKQSDSKPIVPQSTESPISTGSPNYTLSPSPSATNMVPKRDSGSTALGQIYPNRGYPPTPVHTQKPPGVLESAQTINNSVWQAVARNAWNFFQQGIGVDADSGLLSAPFTDWDIGAYIQAVIDASKLGLIDNGSDWGFTARIDKVLTFLETRELNSTTNYPFWFYQPDGTDFHSNSDFAQNSVDIADTGRLLVALNNLKAYSSNFSTRINNLVYNAYDNRSNYAILVPMIKSYSLFDNSIYAYYVYSGFASFWPENLSSAPSIILSNSFAAGNVTTNNVSLPLIAVTGDPLLCSVFELNNNDSSLIALMNQFYLAHESYYNATGRYRAFGEGPSLSTDWQWEWVVLPNGRTWVPLNSADQDTNMSPVIYTKIALGFLAIYNTTFAANMSIYLEHNLPEPTHGYYDGIDESGNQLSSTNSLTNSLILDASLYSILHNP